MEHLIGGFTAGALSTVLLHPLDVVKVRFQGKVNPSEDAVELEINDKSKNNSVLKAVQSIGRENGDFKISRLYRGLSANFLGATVSWSLYFVIYEKIKAAWLTTNSSISAFQYFCFSSASGSMLVCLTNPIWLVKTRLCANNSPGTPGYYTGILDAFSRIYRMEGFKGFYRGFVPGLVGSSHGAIQFMIYEKMKESYRKYISTTDPGSIAILTMSSSSKLVASFSTFPYQVIRSRMQINQSAVVNGKSSSITGMAKSIWNSEGVHGFYKGFIPTAFRVLPATCITFLTYETVTRILRERNQI